ncbi:MAG: TldD/PmbA family protein [Methylococcaceae bacterium]
MNLADSTRMLLDRLSAGYFDALTGDEALSLNVSGEDQLYLRLNQTRVRQTTRVLQRRLTLNFQSKGRRVVYSFDLSGDPEQDLATGLSLLARARQEVTVLPEDPFVVPIVNHGTSSRAFSGSMPELGQLLDDLRAAAGDSDFTGLYAGGSQLRAIRNSAGLDHWFSTDSFFLDYSIFTVNAGGENKAVKGLYAGRDWRADQLGRLLSGSLERLTLLSRASHSVEPGNYRVYFAPAAVDAMIKMFSWGAISYGAWRKGDSAFQKLIEGETVLSPLFSLNENFGLGLAPGFNSLGEIAPDCLPLIVGGQLKTLLTSARSAREYGVVANGAEPGGEGMRSPDMLTGTLAEADVLSALGTGLYVENLHYLNWSDLQNARITGMTRYACFWVENSRIVAPIRDLRFDESLYRIFGSELEAVNSEAEIHIHTDTYTQRSLGGGRVPGILLRDFRFTL